jgi:hypothetical protein
MALFLFVAINNNIRENRGRRRIPPPTGRHPAGNLIRQESVVVNETMYPFCFNIAFRFG